MEEWGCTHNWWVKKANDIEKGKKNSTQELQDRLVWGISHESLSALHVPIMLGGWSWPNTWSSVDITEPALLVLHWWAVCSCLTWTGSCFQSTQRSASTACHEYLARSNTRNELRPLSNTYSSLQLSDLVASIFVRNLKSQFSCQVGHSPSCVKRVTTDVPVTGSVVDRGGQSVCRSPAPMEKVRLGPPGGGTWMKPKIVPTSRSNSSLFPEMYAK